MPKHIDPNIVLESFLNDNKDLHTLISPAALKWAKKNLEDLYETYDMPAGAWLLETGLDESVFSNIESGVRMAAWCVACEIMEYMASDGIDWEDEVVQETADAFRIAIMIGWHMKSDWDKGMLKGII